MVQVRANTLVLTLLLSVATVAQPRSAFAEIAGHLARVFGDVRIDETRANTGDTFESGATISTGNRAFSVLKFTDGQVVALRAESVLSVDDYLYAENDLPDSRSQTSLLQGGMRALTGIIGDENPESVSYSTPVATIGIRGTEMVIGVQSVAGNTAPSPGQAVNLSNCFRVLSRVFQDEVEVRYPKEELNLVGRRVSRCEDLTREDLRTLTERVRQLSVAELEVVAVSQGESFGFVEGQEVTESEAEAIIDSDDSPVEGLEALNLAVFQEAEDTAAVDNSEALPQWAALEEAPEEQTVSLVGSDTTVGDTEVGGSGSGSGSGSGGGGGGGDVLDALDAGDEPATVGSNAITGQ